MLELDKIAIQSKRLGDLINLKRGYDLTAGERIEGIHPVISSSGITGFHNEYKVKGEGVITGRYGTLGEPLYYNGEYWPHNTTLYVENFRGNYPKYIYYLLKALSIKRSDKSTVPGVNRNDMHELVVPVIEDYQDQKSVAEILWLIDSKIQLNNKINKALESLAGTLYNYWFVQFDFPISAAQARAIGQPQLEGKPYQASGGPMEYNAVLKRDVPVGWRDGGFNEIAEIVGGSTPSKSVDENFTSDGIAWITPKDLALNEGNNFISKGEIDITELGMKSASLRLLPKGTVLLSSRAPIGYVAVSRNNVTTNQGFKSFIPKDGYSTVFIFHLIKSHIPIFIQFGSGSTFKEISKSTIEDLNIIIPPKLVIERFTIKMMGMFNMQDNLELQNQELIRLRDFLLPLLMNGQVRVKGAGEEGLSMAAEPRKKFGK